MRLRLSLKLLLPLYLLSGYCFAQSDWSQAQQIVSKIHAPQFRNKDYKIAGFGAKAGAAYDSRTAINTAIATCSREGGGRVVIPSGKFLSKGPIVLKSKVNLYLEPGAELIFSAHEEDYLPVVFTKWEGTELYNYSPMIYAYQANDIAITGKGLINAMGDANFANWKPQQKNDQQAIREMGRKGTPVKERVFGKGHYLRPGVLEPIACKNILIEGVKIVNSTFWNIHPIYCDNVTVRGVQIDSKNFNSDGCDPESTTNVLIENCNFSTGDDCIAIKAGRDQDGWRVGKPTENVVIRNCLFESTANAVCIGSEISGGVRNVFVENIKVTKAGNAIYFKSNLDRGGFIEHIRVRNIAIDSVRSAVVRFEPDYKSESKQNYPTRFKDYRIENVSAKYGGEYGIDIMGYDALPVSDVKLNNIAIAKAEQPLRLHAAQNVSFTNVTVNGTQLSATAPVNKSVSLNGTWDVNVGDELPQTYASKVAVPGVISMANPKLVDDPHGTDHATIPYNYVWYRHQFQMNEQGYLQAILKIRAKYNAKVWLNGQEIGYDAYSTYSHGNMDISKALNFKGRNELVVRVGSWNTATSPSKETSAEWWRNSRAPGIWDDVSIELGQPVSISLIKVLPDISKKTAHCEVEAGNTSAADARITIAAAILDDGKTLAQKQLTVDLKANNTGSYAFDLPAGMLQTWNPGKEGRARLYDLNVRLLDGSGQLLSDKTTRFGYRNIEVKGTDVLVNGKKLIFRAENVVFNRALNRWDDVMFNEAWIRKFLRAAVQEYNYNYLRIHLGHAYNKWYDIADEEGIMLQDEWRYMHDDDPQGQDREDARNEFMRWVKQNVNHASIVAWDQENEGNVRLKDVKDQIRAYDPTRLWEDDDFDATHNYGYSETIVSAPSYKISKEKPTTVLESVRLWPNEFGFLEPRENFKTSRTSTAWGVYYYTKDLMCQMQADIQSDLGTWVRNSRMQAWSPFAILSGWVNGQNAFLGDLADSLSPKPALVAMKHVNEPFGASIDMLQAHEWYKDKTVYKPKSSFSKKIFIWNDLPQMQKATLSLVVKDGAGKVISKTEAPLSVASNQSIGKTLSFTSPASKGVYYLQPVLKLANGKTIDGVVRRIMVTQPGDQSVIGLMGFGGSRVPINGGQSIFEHFLGYYPNMSIQQAVISLLGNEGLLDKITVDAKDSAYTVQSTVYKSSTRSIVTTTRMDRNGKVLSAKQAEALNYVDLPANLKTTIANILGTVPVDESKLLKTMSGDDSIYDITVVGSDQRYRLTIAPDGSLKQKEIIGKGDKNRIKNQ